MTYSGYIINDDILEKRQARKAKKAEKWRARQIALAKQHDSCKRCGRRR